MLFFDARLSVHGYTSCAMCHLPERGFADGVPASVRFLGEPMSRNAPAWSNVRLQTRGTCGTGGTSRWSSRRSPRRRRAGSLGAGARQLGVTDLDRGIDRVRRLPGYVEAFDKAYPGEPISRETAAKAIATFERSLVSEGLRVRPMDPRRRAGDDATPGPGLSCLRRSRRRATAPCAMPARTSPTTPSTTSACCSTAA
jgi:cytochrome c peroxidase